MKELNFVRYETGENAITINNQPHKMVKHTQTIRRQKPTNCLSVFDHFVGLALTGLKTISHTNKKMVYHIELFSNSHLPQKYLLHPKHPLTLKRQPHKMDKHTQTIYRQQPANCLSVFDHFVGLVLKGLTGREPNEEGIFHNFKATSAA